ncbi:MAG: hypothetical protein ACXVLO_15380 [Acidimicrobiia bacterium]
MRFTVDPWDPSYGGSVETQLDPSEVAVNAAIECPADAWGPMEPVAPPAPTVLFVDGVRRIDARVWITDDEGVSEPGVCASYAAGVVRAAERAEVVQTAVRRGVFSASRAMRPIATRYPEVTYAPYAAADGTPESLWIAIQEQMARVEIEMAGVARAAVDADALVLLDGPVTNRTHIAGAVGVIKTHAIAYLPRELHLMVGDLPPRARTPLFTIGGRGSRHSWYVRLPGGTETPWSGVVRCECSAAIAPLDAIALAETVTATLPRYASEPHKDPRAPQNLYPVGGLERDLRHRLGDPDLLYRALRLSSAAVPTP